MINKKSIYVWWALAFLWILAALTPLGNWFFFAFLLVVTVIATFKYLL